MIFIGIMIHFRFNLNWIYGRKSPFMKVGTKARIGNQTFGPQCYNSRSSGDLQKVMMETGLTNGLWNFNLGTISSLFTDKSNTPAYNNQLKLLIIRWCTVGWQVRKHCFNYRAYASTNFTSLTFRNLHVKQRQARKTTIWNNDFFKYRRHKQIKEGDKGAGFRKYKPGYFNSGCCCFSEWRYNRNRNWSWFYPAIKLTRNGGDSNGYFKKEWSWPILSIRLFNWQFYIKATPKFCPSLSTPKLFLYAYLPTFNGW